MHPQGDRIAKQSQEAGEVGFVPTGSLDLSAERAFLTVFLHDVQDHVAGNGEMLGAVTQPASVLILVHGDVEPPVQAIFDAQWERPTSLKRSGVKGALSRQ